MRPTGSPETRASFAHDLMAATAELGPDVRAAVVERSGAAWTTIEQTPGVVWLDERTYDTFCEALRATLGDTAFVDVSRRCGRRLTKNASLQAAIDALTRLLGVTPHTGLKFAPRGRSMLVRSCGELSYERLDDGRARLTLVIMPTCSCRLETLALLLQGTWLGAVEAFNGQSPVVDILRIDHERGDVVWDVRWSA